MHTVQRIITQILPYEQLVNIEGGFFAEGQGIDSGGTLTMSSLKRPISPFEWQLEGDTSISWLTEGSGKYMPL
jgi:hypothetical protein